MRIKEGKQVAIVPIAAGGATFAILFAIILLAAKRRYL